MGVDRSLVVGYGFVVSDEEAEEFLTRVGYEEPEDVDDGMYEVVEQGLDDVETARIGNMWTGNTGFLVALRVRQSEAHAGSSAGTNDFNLYELKEVIPDNVDVLYEAKRQIIPNVEDRFVGWHVGIYTF